MLSGRPFLISDSDSVGYLGNVFFNRASFISQTKEISGHKNPEGSN